jgi:hypothetical protein
MLASRNAKHHQIAYVTNDMDRALNVFSKDYGVARFYPLLTGAEPPRPDGLHLKVGLANVNGTEVELIQPLGETRNLYSDALPADGRFTLELHHLCIRIAGNLEDWQRHRASIDEKAHPIALEGAYGDYLRVLYTDERDRLGHYLEHLWMSPFVLEKMAELVPSFPTAPLSAPVAN